MTKDELVENLLEIRLKWGHDEEKAYLLAGELLLEYINDDRVSAAFEAIPKWYA